MTGPATELAKHFKVIIKCHPLLINFWAGPVPVSVNGRPGLSVPVPAEAEPNTEVAVVRTRLLVIKNVNLTRRVERTWRTQRNVTEIYLVQVS